MHRHEQGRETAETAPGEIECGVMVLGAAYAAAIICLILWLSA